MVEEAAFVPALKQAPAVHVLHELGSKTRQLHDSRHLGAHTLGSLCHEVLRRLRLPPRHETPNKTRELKMQLEYAGGARGVREKGVGEGDACVWER